MSALSGYSICFADAEAKFVTVPGEDPEKSFRREWARSVFLAAMDRFKQELAESGRATRFEIFRRFYGVGGGSQQYADIVRELGVSEGDVANYLHRARARFREVLVEELRHGVSREEDVEGELRDLLESL